MYKLIKSNNGSICVVQKLSNNHFIPFDTSNTDYQQFKTDMSNGVELQDVDGNIMTPEQVQEFISTLP